MANYQDLTGQKFNRFTIVRRAGRNKNQGILWECLCDCGTMKILSTASLKSDNTKSCGCLKLERIREVKKDLTGQIFGRLTVVSLEPQTRIGAHNKYLCKCECGGTKIIDGAHLRAGHTKSCGCIVKENAALFNKGKPSTNRLAYGEGNFNSLFRRYNRMAEKAERDFTIGKEEFKHLTKQNCHYCGIEPFQESGGSRRGYGTYIYNSLDRVDSTGGYSVDNVVACDDVCNTAKNDMDQEQFYSWVSKVYSHLKKTGRIKECPL